MIRFQPAAKASKRGIGTRHFLAALGIALAAAGAASAQSADPLPVRPVPSSPIADGFTLAAVGDLIYLRPMLATIEKRSPAMLKILRDADVTFGNFETTALDLASFKGSPQAESGGTWMLADPRVVPDIARMGFDIVSHANNHATDWGVEGMAETLVLLDKSAIVYAGTGRNLTAARAPRYFDAPAGRVALVAATSSFTPMSRASDPLGEVPGRPGANTLRTERVGQVSTADLATLARLAGTRDGAPVRFNGMRYEAVANAATPMATAYITNVRDEKANLTAVRQAHQNGNFVAFSLHNHEPGNGSQVPAPFAVDFARKVIDAGGDAFIGHGPHQLRGIEIYKGRPIFYSLGNFAMMNNSLDAIPADFYEQYDADPATITAPELLQSRGERSFGDPNLYESVIAVSRYVGGKVVEIRLYPIDLGVSAQGAAKGVPGLADATVGRRILERMQRLSEPLGTTVAIENGVGVIRVSAR
ncbi:MAG: capsule biosynthesis protein [Alphaproteobacteria bacterium]|nr:MAG: capsule biosynthesis protein [Alphaproteobacteria bacterium]